MMSSFGTHQIYLARDTIDMRKSINGLITIVQACFRLDPFSSTMFVFTNHQRNKIKILQWDMNGFWIHYKRLESGKFNGLGKMVPMWFQWIGDSLDGCWMVCQSIKSTHIASPAQALLCKRFAHFLSFFLPGKSSVLLI